MPFEKKVALPGSLRALPDGAQHIGEAACDEVVHVTVVLKGIRSPRPIEGTVKHEHFAWQHGARPDDIATVEAFAHHAGLTVVEASEKKRLVKLAGSLEGMSAAFRVPLACFRTESGKNFRGRDGSIHVPEELADSVVAVLGLDTRPVAKPHFRAKAVPHCPPDTEPEVRIPAGAFTPQQVAQAYNFPKDVNGAGQTIAIIELGGGYDAADLNHYFSELRVHPQPKITAVSVDGGHNRLGDDADGEVQLDIQIAGAIAPGSDIVVYFAPNTDQGFVDAISAAVHDNVRRPSIISISWGGPDSEWTSQAVNAMNSVLQDAAALGVSICVAAGDDGSSDGITDGRLHVDFPASSPWVLACGGTKLIIDKDMITSEVVWNESANQEGATGGGVSTTLLRPAYQDAPGVNVPLHPMTGFNGRCVPDVAGLADPATGYFVRINGEDTTVGGTSCTAPLYAGLVALINQKLGKPVGFVNPRLYEASSDVFRDVDQGDNDDAGLGSFSARQGFDCCTGLGVIRGEKLLEYLAKTP